VELILTLRPVGHQPQEAAFGLESARSN
jgi:hypothetical protein